MYVDSSAERITTAPTSLGSDLKLYLPNKTVMSASASCFHTCINSHFICDLPPIWEHAGA